MSDSPAQPKRFQRSSTIVRYTGFILCLGAVILLTYLVSIDFEINPLVIGPVAIVNLPLLGVLLFSCASPLLLLIALFLRPIKKTRKYSLAHRTRISISTMHLCSNVHLFVWRTSLCSWWTLFARTCKQSRRSGINSWTSFLTLKFRRHLLRSLRKYIPRRKR